MKDAMIIIVIIAIIIGGDLCTKKYLNKLSDELIESLKKLKEETIAVKQTGDREEIKKQMEDIEQKWDNTNEIWSIISIHQELDNIEQALIKTKSNINDGDLEDAIQELETAMFFIEHVKDREQVSLKNIF